MRTVTSYASFVIYLLGTRDRRIKIALEFEFYGVPLRLHAFLLRERIKCRGCPLVNEHGRLQISSTPSRRHQLLNCGLFVVTVFACKCRVRLYEPFSPQSSVPDFLFHTQDEILRIVRRIISRRLVCRLPHTRYTTRR